MRHLIAILFSIIIPISLVAQAKLKPFILRGTIKGLDSGYVYLNYKVRDHGKLDSVELHQGDFSIKGYISEPVKAYFSTFGPQSADPDYRNFTAIYIEPGKMHLAAALHHFDQINLRGSGSELEWEKFLSSGSAIKKESKLLQDKIKRYRSRLQKINGKDNISAKPLLDKKIDSLNQVMLNLDKQYMAVDSGFISNHLNSYVSADLLSGAKNYWLSFPSLVRLYNHFPPNIQNSYAGMRIKNKIEKEKQTAIGSAAKDFMALDHKNDTISPGDYKGKKYVLLDFGASWCEPCRKIIPVLKKLYEKYDTAFTIISIATQEKYKPWLEAVRKDDAPWPQIFENSRHLPLYPHNTINDTYAITGFPSLILLDKNSRIIGKFGSFYSSGPAYMADLKKQLHDIFSR